ncbi:MAG: radical SAM protein [Bacteroidales bacterium]|nr:radical SAM protein [Bacteroidales bacterium]
MVSSYHPHFGEEGCLVGRNGSGTIFFTNCNLLCSFCQNYSISHQGNGEEVTDEELAAMMLHLQKQGCHNINFVTPSHVIPQIVSAVAIACEQGLNIPMVYNSGGYDSVESIQMLEGIIDIYMPDLKFSDPVIARETCNAPDYFDVAKKAIREMHRQVGDLKMNSQGIATRGLLVRHLVMPEDSAGTEKIMEFLANEISKDTFVNIMDQYYPCGETWKECRLGRAITCQEYLKAMNIASSAGLSRFG